MKKLLFTLFAALLTLNVAAQVNWPEGPIQVNNLSWSFILNDDKKSGTLKISGNGTISDYNNTTETPWHNWIVASVPDPVTFETTPYYLTKYTTKIIIEEGITQIGKNAFANFSEVTEIVLPKTLKSILENAFYGCSELNTLNGELTNLENVAASSFEGTKLLNINDKILIINSTLFCAKDASEKLDLTKHNVTKIAKGAFKNNTNLESIIIPSTVNSIEDETFSGLKINTITFNGDINTLGQYAFWNCKELNEVKFNGYVKNIEKHAFDGCSKLSSINIPNTVETFGENIFSGCTNLPTDADGDFQMAGDHIIVKVANTGKRKYTIKENIIYIAENAFYNCDKLKIVEFLGDAAPQTTTTSFQNKFQLQFTTITQDKASGFDNEHFTNVNTTKLDLKANELTTCTFLHNAVVPAGIAVYRAVVIPEDKIKLQKINSGNTSCTIKAGDGVILKAYQNDGLREFKKGTEAPITIDENHLVGCKEDTKVKGNTGAYGIKGQEFVRINVDTTIPVGKAYLDADLSTNNVRIVYEDPEMEHAWETSIEDVNTDNNKNNARIYNMAGQRLNSTQSGLNIVDGKIVIK